MDVLNQVRRNFITTEGVDPECSPWSGEAIPRPHPWNVPPQLFGVEGVPFDSWVEMG